jgi:hypothetical protein
MVKLIGYFDIWKGLIETVGRTLHDLFSNDQGAASSIIVSLTTMLDRLDAWITSTQGHAQLTNIFEAHKQQILALLNLLPALFAGLGRVYLTVAPALTRAMATVLGAIAPVLDALSRNPAGAWLIGLTLLATKLGFMPSLISPVIGAFKNLAAAVGTSLARLVLPEALLSQMGVLSSDTEQVGTHFKSVGSDAEAGAAGAAGALDGLLGPLAIVGAAAAVGAIALRMTDVPNALSNVKKGIDGINSSLASMPTGNVLQATVTLDAMQKSLGQVTANMVGMKAGSAALENATGQAQALNSAIIGTTRDTVTMNANTSVLAKTFGISTTDVQNFAEQVGVNLKAKLDPTQVRVMGQAVKESGDTFNKAALAPPTWASAVALAANQAVAASVKGNSTLNTDATEAMALHAIILRKGGTLAIANFVNAQTGGLPQVLAVAQQYGVKIPNQYLAILVRAMQSSGKESITGLTGNIQGGAPALAAALQGINFIAASNLTGMQAIFAAKGAAAGAALAAGLLSESGAVSAAAANLVAIAAGAARTAGTLAAEAAASDTSAQMDAARAAAVQARATAAAQAALHPKGAAAMGTPNWQGGPLLVGERGPEVLNLPRGSAVTPNNKLGGTTVTLIDNRSITISGGGSAAQTKVAVQQALDADRKKLVSTLRQKIGSGQ